MCDSCRHWLLLLSNFVMRGQRWPPQTQVTLLTCRPRGYGPAGGFQAFTLSIQNNEQMFRFPDTGCCIDIGSCSQGMAHIQLAHILGVSWKEHREYNLLYNVKPGGHKPKHWSEYNPSGKSMGKDSLNPRAANSDTLLVDMNATKNIVFTKRCHRELRLIEGVCQKVQYQWKIPFQDHRGSSQIAALNNCVTKELDAHWVTMKAERAETGP